MSYDLWLDIDTGGPEPATVGRDFNYTGNCAPMWRKAGIDFNACDGRTAGECVPWLRTAILAMEAYPDAYRVMDPPNGWGSYDTLVPWMKDVLADWERHPKATVRCHR